MIHACGRLPSGHSGNASFGSHQFAASERQVCTRGRSAMTHPYSRRAPLLRPIGRLLPLVERNVIAAGNTRVELARTADLLVRVLDHLAPLADPADGAGDR